MKSKVIHCRVTEQQHETIAAAAKRAGISITQYVLRAALSEPATASR